MHAHTCTHILTQKKRTRKCYLTTDSQRKHGCVNRSREQSNLITNWETRKIISHHHKWRRVSSASSERALLETFSIQSWETITFYRVKPLKSGHIAYQAKQNKVKQVKMRDDSSVKSEDESMHCLQRTQVWFPGPTTERKFTTIYLASQGTPMTLTSVGTGSYAHIPAHIHIIKTYQFF